MNGIVYIAYGEQYIQEAQQSAQSVKAVCDLPTCLISNTRRDGFDDYIYLEPLETKYPLLNKPYALSSVDLPYDRFIFLDSDTHILGDISQLFNLLDYFDIGVSYCRDGQYCRFGLPMFNTGVILVDNSRNENSIFLSEWYKIAMLGIDVYKHNDQSSFWHCIFYGYGGKMFILTQEFNVRVSQQVPLTDKAYILHGRGVRLQSAIKEINKHTTPRIWNGKKHSYSLVK